jgi:hypothetical protein
MKQIGLFDNVRVIISPLTEEAGLAGLFGQVYGVTTPSDTLVEVLGGAPENRAFSVRFRDERQIWVRPDLLEFVDHAPGTSMSVGSKMLIRNGDGSWKDVSNS